MIRTPLIFAALIASLSMTAGVAGVVEETEFNAVEEKLRGLVPNATTIAVSETPIDGLLQGQIINIDTRTNITDQAKSSIRMSLLTGLKREEQISFAPDNPSYDLLVFTDIDCGYCRKLHNQVPDYNEQGIAIHYLAFPRAGIGSDSYEKYVSAWCAEDQQAALTLAKNGGAPEPKVCDNPIAEQYDLGREIGVTGTPAIVTADGTLIPGYVPPAQLRQRLEAMQVQAN